MIYELLFIFKFIFSLHFKTGVYRKLLYDKNDELHKKYLLYVVIFFRFTNSILLYC